MFKLLSLLVISLTIGSILAMASPAPQESCITCPPIFIPACSALCPTGDDCIVVPRPLRLSTSIVVSEFDCQAEFVKSCMPLLHNAQKRLAAWHKLSNVEAGSNKGF
ncbi:hypothetical protein DFH09DRAFT_1088432 [Mycena vulgaris]|nr:hypothetical protein DFH09DRAFT_1088432 [Mycena vulgaris]